MDRSPVHDQIAATLEVHQVRADTGGPSCEKSHQHNLMGDECFLAVKTLVPAPLNESLYLCHSAGGHSILTSYLALATAE